ncbi:MAG TPA: VWA domain-containing protein [Pyrinomonadaceae bacterium]
MFQRPPTRLMSALLLLLVGALALAPSTAPARQQPPTLQRQQKDFGSSLKRLKWDDKKKEAVEADGARDKKAGGGTDDEVVRVETSLVIANVLVLDPRGRAVSGLTREDFVVSEDGRPQEVSVFAAGASARTPRSVVLIMDYSGSLGAYLKMSIEAAKVLVEQLGPGDRMAVVTDDVKLFVDFTSDKSLLKEKLDSIKALATANDPHRGWSAGHSIQYSALLAVLRELFDEEDVRPVVVFQTDGDELTILRRPGGEDRHSGLRRPFSLADVYRAAEISRATVYSVIPGPRLIGLSSGERLKRGLGILEAHDLAAQAAGAPPLTTPWRSLPVTFIEREVEKLHRMQKALALLAEMTGGWTSFLETPSQAAGIYSRISADIGHRYVVGYYPTNKARNGVHRKVNVEVRGHPEYTLIGRKSYRAPKD